MVAPVKRVVPLTPVIKTEAGDKKAATSKDKLGKDTKRAERAKVVGDTPNCDTGFKVDPSGKSCVKIASSEQPAKKRKK